MMLKVGNMFLNGQPDAGKLTGISSPELGVELTLKTETCLKFIVSTPEGEKKEYTFDGGKMGGVKATLEWKAGTKPGFVHSTLNFQCEKGWWVKEINLIIPTFVLPGDDTLVLPSASGLRIKNPAKALFVPVDWKTTPWKDRMLGVSASGLLPKELADATERTYNVNASMPFMEYYSSLGFGMYMGFHDNGFEKTKFSVNAVKDEPGVGFELCKTLNRPMSQWNCDFVLGLHPGDWHAGADYYREFFNTTPYKPRRSNAASPGLSCHYDLLWQNGDINHRFNDLPEVARIAREQGFDTILCAAWNRGGFDTNYPDFRPDPKLGTEEEFKEAIRKVHQDGSKILFYNNAFSFDNGTQGYKEHGADAAIVQENGTTIDVRWGCRVLTSMCVGSKWWQEKILDNIRYLVQECGADGVYLDQLNCTPPICHNEKHVHDRSAIARRVWIVEEARRRFGEDIILLSEWSDDAMASVLDFQLIQTIWRNIEHTFPEFFRYTFPEAGCVDMILQKPWPGKDPEIEGRYVRYVFNRLFLCGIKFWCYDHVPYTAGFQEYFRNGINLWLKHKEQFNTGIFRDDADIQDCPNGILAKTFNLPDGKIMITAVNNTGKPAHITLKNGSSAELPANELSVTIR